MDGRAEGIVLNGTQLSYVGQEALSIPGILGSKYGKLIKRLDVSFNCLKTLKGVGSFEFLEELILDNNELDDNLEIPNLCHLHTLTLNKNKIVNLEKLLEKISNTLPSLVYLSLLGNYACPNELSFTDRDEEDYQRYRYYVLYKLPKLKFLDSRPVKEDERKEAQRVGAYMRIVAPSEDELTKPEQKKDAAESDAFKYTPLPSSSGAPGEHTGAFGRCRYVYYGKHSEGNRFIRNNEL